MKTGPVWLDGWCESGPLGQIVAALLLCSFAPLAQGNWKGLFCLLILIADSAQTEYCPTFPLSVRVFVCHRRDISHFSHI